MNSRPDPRTSAFARLRMLPRLAAALLWAAGASAAHAQAAAAPDQPVMPAEAAAPAGAPDAGASLPAGARTYSVPLYDLGARQGLPLRGVDGYNGVDFGLRADERVVRARLLMDYTYSPALLPELSHIKVQINGDVADSIALPKETAGAPQQRAVDLPVPALRDFNRLGLQLIGHYTLRCEDPVHSSLWANVGPRSALELSVVPVDLPNDLALLPVPFFDPRDGRPLELPVVMPGAPGTGRLEAAGIVSSWLGALAGYRGASFPVSLDALPARGHAVVLARQGDALPALQLPALSGPTLAIVANPNDAHGKLLLVLGRDDAEIRQAATALALGHQTLSGPTAAITRLVVPEARQPYDAPNWLRRDRPTQFGELLPASQLTVYGHRPAPVNLNLRLPPGLFGWRSDGVPIDLRYRYSPRPGAHQSVLEITAGDQLVQSVSLRSERREETFSRVFGMPLSESRATVQVPTYMLPPLAALQFRYIYEYAKLGECQNSIVDNIMSAIDPASTIDISGLPQYAPMPDLRAYADAGFPFTRMADLSETAVILPDQPGPADYSAYLGLLGAMGESTGYPGVGVTVAQAAQADALRGKDLLVLASGDNQPLLKRWHGDLPSGFDGSRGFGISDWLSRTLDWRGDDPRDRRASAHARVASTSSGATGVLAGMESPLSSGRSVVVVSGSNADGLAAAVRAVRANRNNVDKIEGSVAVIHGAEVSSLANEQSYYVGSLPPWLAVQWFFANHPLLLVLAVLSSAMVIAVLVYLSLRARAQRRLGS